MTLWARRRGGRVERLDTGFVLPNGARRSPDASWISPEQMIPMPEDEDIYPHFCPEFVIELRSQSERLNVLRDKMREYVESGAQFGWLIDPKRRAVEIYRPGAEPEVRENIDRIAGEGPVESFVLDLKPVWDPK